MEPGFKSSRGVSGRDLSKLAKDALGVHPTLPHPMSTFTMPLFSLAALYEKLSMPMAHPSQFVGGGCLTSDGEKLIPVPLLSQAKPEVLEGFYVFTEGSPCPDDRCVHLGQRHFHCCQPRCYYATNRDDILELHSKDFHDNIDIYDGFAFFDRNVDCRFAGCVHNKVSRHFHCTRCNFNFVRYLAINAHKEVHRAEEASAVNSNLLLNHPNNDTPRTVVSTTVSQYSSESDESDSEECGRFGKLSKCEEEARLQMERIKAAGTYYPLSGFKKKSFKAATQLMTSLLQNEMASEEESGEEAADTSDDLPKTPTGEPFQRLLQDHIASSFSNAISLNMFSSPPPPPPPETATKRGKLAAAANANSLKVLKDEPVPAGYIRYRFNEDCNYVHCGYREHQTHFHCMRSNCGYSFCDKTRFVQHTARHQRLDTLMGGDFHQYRSSVPCGRPECLYGSSPPLGESSGSKATKASHFHCLKCEFVCTDTNKVVAHRRQHAKMDSINAAGFEKYTPSQDCANDGCNHNRKQTHYHCLKCHYAVLGLSQMSSHKYKHAE